VHLPIAFLLTSSVLDITSAIGLHTPTLLYPLVRLTTFTSSTTTNLDTIALLNYLALFSYASTVAGLITAVPAILTGATELYAMVKAKGLDLKNPVVRTTLTHAGLNDLAIVGAAFNWWSRRGKTGYAVETGNAVVSAVMLVGVMYAAFLGGGLVYEHGVAVQRMGKGKQEKDAQTVEIKQQAKKEL